MREWSVFNSRWWGGGSPLLLENEPSLVKEYYLEIPDSILNAAVIDSYDTTIDPCKLVN